MKSLLYPLPTTAASSSKELTIIISRRALFVSLLLITAFVGLLLPLSFVIFGILAFGGAGVSGINFYREISSLDFSSEDYSLTLEEIIEDLEG